jgi:hypothetical protein
MLESNITPMTKTEQRKQLVAKLKDVLAKQEAWAVRAMLLIYRHQTDDEQNKDSTDHQNDVGFNSNDAFILSQFAKSYEQWGRLTPKQLAIVHRKMPKYARQLIMHTGEEKVANALAKIS